MENLTELVTNPVLLSTIAGILLSLVFGFVPGLRERFDAKADDFKQSFMLLLQGLVLLGLSFLFEVDLMEVLMMILGSVGGNNIIFSATKHLRPTRRAE